MKRPHDRVLPCSEPHAALSAGLQQSTHVFRSDGNPIVETTYGLLTLNDHNIWTWVCEEISGTESAWHFALNQNDRWLLTGLIAPCGPMMGALDRCKWRLLVATSPPSNPIRTIVGLWADNRDGTGCFIPKMVVRVLNWSDVWGRRSIARHLHWKPMGRWLAR